MPSTPGERTEQRAEISEALQDNLDKVASFSQREEAKASSAQRTLERITLFFGNPRVLLAFVAFCVVWIVTDCVFKYLRGAYNGVVGVRFSMPGDSARDAQRVTVVDGVDARLEPRRRRLVRVLARDLKRIPFPKISVYRVLPPLLKKCAFAG
jgi:hypothetical protein